MAKKKLYKSVLRVEILSEEPYPDSVTLEQVAYDICEGDCSGITDWESHNAELHGTEAVKECEKQGSCPSFFQMNEDGDEIDE